MNGKKDEGAYDCKMAPYCKPIIRCSKCPFKKLIDIVRDEVVCDSDILCESMQRLKQKMVENGFVDGQ